MTRLATHKNEPTSLKSVSQKDRVEVVSLGDGLLVMIGPVTLVLDLVTAEEMMVGLGDALEQIDLLDRDWN